MYFDQQIYIKKSFENFRLANNSTIKIFIKINNL